MSDDERLDELLVRWKDEYKKGRDLSPQELCSDSPHLARAPPRKSPSETGCTGGQPGADAHADAAERRRRAARAGVRRTALRAATTSRQWRAGRRVRGSSMRKSAAKSPSSASNRGSPTSQTAAPASSARPRSPAGWNIPASCHCTAGAGCGRPAVLRHALHPRPEPAERNRGILQAGKR